MSSTIRLTTLGHSCVLVDVRSGSGALARIMLDPGNLTPPLDAVDGLDAVLVTHAHPDHVDAEQVRRLQSAGPVAVHGDPSTASVLEDVGANGVVVTGPGTLKIAGVSVEVSTSAHEEVYPGVPVPANLAYRIADRVFAPGDAFAVPEFDVDVLLLPTGAPWMKLSESIDYLRAVAPRVAVPVHDAGLATAHRELHRGLMEKFAPEGTTVLRPEVGESFDL
ncbi:MBL fold metallo-hydrolase [Paraoerskovia sediminicola]|uniref:MBL fold metallo-hydrolase n=1 Tax=Paraoerskovia sediminicola TaxID=1138587 RepID=A0ABM8G315_9CELL|nr:MBL fold metallo-hydrolase [Paraoerskovia sediminicola]BDZ42430.1 MBL fold metallo-hydrolase [Paraoerskovia sediminicola]